MTGGILTGWQFSLDPLYPFLKTSIIFACFRIFGRIPLLRQEFMEIATKYVGTVLYYLQQDISPLERLQFSNFLKCFPTNITLNCRNTWMVTYCCCFFSPMYNHTTYSQLYYKHLQNLQRPHAKYAQSTKTNALNLRNTARKTLRKSAMPALSPKPNTFVC